jgi:hypothetical protein
MQQNMGEYRVKRGCNQVKHGGMLSNARVQCGRRYGKYWGKKKEQRREKNPENKVEKQGNRRGLQKRKTVEKEFWETEENAENVAENEGNMVEKCGKYGTFDRLCS